MFTSHIAQALEPKKFRELITEQLATLRNEKQWKKDTAEKAKADEGFAVLLKRIVAVKFPDLEGTDDSDDY